MHYCIDLLQENVCKVNDIASYFCVIKAPTSDANQNSELLGYFRQLPYTEKYYFGVRKLLEIAEEFRVPNQQHYFVS